MSPGTLFHKGFGCQDKGLNYISYPWLVVNSSCSHSFIQRVLRIYSEPGAMLSPRNYLERAFHYAGKILMSGTESVICLYKYLTL